jgi:hypothetical protein
LLLLQELLNVCGSQLARLLQSLLFAQKSQQVGIHHGWSHAVVAVSSSQARFTVRRRSGGGGSNG